MLIWIFINKTHAWGRKNMKIDELKSNSKCSRGYCGYFLTKRNNNLYLRSLKEFIVATWLTNLETRNIELLGEWYVGNYRPDFRIEMFGKTRFVVEVKDNKEEAEKYIELHKKNMNDLGYHYIVIYKKTHFNKLIKKFNIDIQAWKDNSLYDYSGKNNPRFGQKNSDETKRKIGDKTIERNKNKEYMIIYKEKIKNAFTDERRRAISISVKKRGEINREKRNLEDPIIEVSCIWCNKIKNKRKSQIKDVEFCDARCAMPYYKSINKLPKMTSAQNFERFKKNLIVLGKKIITEYGEFSLETLSLAKENKIIRYNAQISEKSIVKYFDSIDNFIQEIK
jgi:hypothetical protein